jgi:hypothetical protein
VGGSAAVGPVNKVNPCWLETFLVASCVDNISRGLMVCVSCCCHYPPTLQELDSLEAELSGCVASGEGDAFCAYLLGVVLLDK